MQQRSRILVVEPNKTNLGVFARRLNDAGYRVITAECGRNAIAELHRSPIDLVVAELHMPRMDGAELARMIRDETIWRDLPVMLVSDRSDRAGAVRAYRAGADDVMLKPFHFEVLFARIERRLARAHSLKALREDNAAMDARIVSRAIEIGEIRERLLATESERRRLQALVASKAA